MRIDKSQIIAGIPAITARDFLAKFKDRLFTIGDAVRYFKIDDTEVVTLIEELRECEYIEAVDFKTHRFWGVTTTGRTLALASAAKPILRKTADKKIAEFLERVVIVNSSNHYLYDVTKVIVFGSYLSEQDRINDIDIGITLKKKTMNETRFKEMCEQSSRQAEKDGRCFSTYVERISWPQREIHLFLKSRSRAISLHPLHDEVLRSVVQKVIFEKIAES